MPVEMIAVAEAQIQRTSIQPATVRPFFEAKVRAQSTGYITSIDAEIGDVVEANAVLAKVDVPEWRQERLVIEARIKQLKAVEQQKKSGVELARSKVASEKAKLESVRSDLLKVQAMLAATEAEFARVSDLVARRSLEDRMLDEVRKKRDSDVAARQAALSLITSAQAEVQVAVAMQAAAEADSSAAIAETAVATSQLNKLDELIKFSELRAPFAGVVTQRNVELGDLVSGTAQGEGTKGDPLFVVSQLDSVRIHIPVPETDAVWVNREDKVTVSFPISSREQIEATVTRLSQSLDESTRTMLVECVVDNPDLRMLPGMFGQATIQTSETMEGKVLPARTIRFDDSGKAYVYVLDAEDRVQIVNVETGSDDGKQIEILGNLQPGQQVVDVGVRPLAAGQKVAVIESQ